MANDLTGDVWTVDTASATALITGWVKIKKIWWDDPMVVGHLVIIQDAAGQVHNTLRCEVAGQRITDFMEDWQNGLLIPTLGSGTLYISFD
jgi:hypothetical protein